MGILHVEGKQQFKRPKAARDKQNRKNKGKYTASVYYKRGIAISVYDVFAYLEEKIGDTCSDGKRHGSQ